jgi:hypothetical protein
VQVFLETDRLVLRRFAESDVDSPVAPEGEVATPGARPSAG